MLSEETYSENGPGAAADETLAYTIYMPVLDF